MQKAVTVLALATVGLAFDDVNSRFPYNPERFGKGFDDISTRIHANFDDVASRTIYNQPTVDPMIIKPQGDVDPLILIRPRPNLDPKIILRPSPQRPTMTYADNEELNVLKSIGNGLKKAGQYVVQHPEVISKGAKLLAHDDEELFSLHQIEDEVKKAGKFLADHPELVKAAEQKAQEIIHKYAGHKDLLKQDAKKALEYVAQHPEILKEAVEVIKNLKHDDEELFNLGGLINDGLNIYKDVKSKDYGNLVNHGIQTVRDIKKHDDEFVGRRQEFSDLSVEGHGIGKDIRKAQANIRNMIYTASVNTGRQLVQNMRNSRTTPMTADDENDNELSYLNHLVKDVKDTKTTSDKKKLVTFDEIEIEDAQYFQENDLFCVSIRVGGFPYQYCK
jgi:hypothetical protein